MTKAEQELWTALDEAVVHLDYCGYGDSWERECAGDMPERMQKVLEKYDPTPKPGPLEDAVA